MKRNDPRNEQVESLWRLGLSFNEIANEVGALSRSVIAGICWRAGLRRTPVRIRIDRKMEEVKEETTEGSVSIMDLQLHHCRWPVGKGDYDLVTYCGKTKIRGSSYCKEHYIKAHNRSPWPGRS